MAGLFERYHLLRDALGFPQLITIVLATREPLDPSIYRERLVKLEDAWPMLRCIRTEEPATRRARYDVESTTRLDRVPVREAYLGSSSTSGFPAPIGHTSKEDPRKSAKQMLRETTDIVERELGNIEAVRVPPLGNAARLYSVTLYHPSGGPASMSNRTSSAECPAGYIALTCNHILTDGKGAYNLFRLLTTSDEERNSLIQAAQCLNPDATLPPKMEDLIDIRPSYFKLIHVIWQALVFPKFPASIRAWIPRHDVWSGRKRHIKPYQAKPKYKLHHIERANIEQLKVLSSKYGVKTLHPIICTALAVAVRKVFSAEGALRPKQAIVVSSPLSERKEDLGLPFTTGNYVSSYDHSFANEPMGSDSFWSEAKKFRDALASSETRKEARGTVGMLSFVPEDPKLGWIPHFRSELESEDPFNASFEISNLGRTQPIPGAEHIVFCQSATPRHCPFIVNALGNEASQQGGLNFAICWRDHGGITTEDIDRILKAFDDTIGGLIEDVPCGSSE